jgi:four helix bundle protein
MDINDLVVYKLAMELVDEIWFIVTGWEKFARDTIGMQWVRSADSVGTNISEGFGRYHFKDSKNFLYFSRGSLSESKTWLDKAANRKLLSETTHADLSDKIKVLGIKLNNYINTTGKTPNTKNPHDIP